MQGSQGAPGTRREIMGGVLAVAVAALLCASPAPAAIDVPQRVADINPGALGSTPLSITPLDRHVLFRASDVSENELWRSDGTVDGTARVADLNPGAGNSSLPGDLIAFGDRVWFFAFSAGTGEEPWATDGTTAGTQMLADIHLGGGSSSPRIPVRLGDRVLFPGDDGGVTGREVWISDGTPAGTSRIADINPGPGNGVGGFWDRDAGDGVVYFAGIDPVVGNELWRTDGTEAGTEFVYNELAGSLSPEFITVAGGWVYFTGDTAAAGRELWRSDGVRNGVTEQVTNIDGAATDSSIGPMVPFRGMVYFAADDGVAGTELWRSDGTAAGTDLVENINPGGADSNPGVLTVVGDTLFFAATDGNNGREIWRSDGEPGGVTEMAEDVNPAGSGICAFPNPTGFDGELYFCGTDGTNGREVWRTDGTEAGTEQVADLDPGGGDADPGGFVPHGDAVYFRADDGTSGSELYALDVAAPETALDTGPAEGEHIADRTPSLGLSSPAVDVARFECSVDGGPFGTCAQFDGVGITERLDDGQRSLAVRAVDVRENPDQSPATRSFVVDARAKIKILGRKAKLKRGRLLVKLRCPKNELTGPCRGKLKLKTRKRVKTSGKKRKLKLAKRKYELDAGKAKRLKLKLSGRERALLAREPAARRLQATASVRDTLGNTGRAKRKLRVPG